MRGKIGRLLALGMLCAGAASCSALPDWVVDPLESKPAYEKKKSKQRGCRPIGNREITYIVRKGDTLGEIAQCYKVLWHNIARRNKLRNPNKIKVGQRLVIPTRAYGAASKPTASKKKRKSAAAPKPAAPPNRAKSGIAWTWPARGKIIRKFSPKASGKQGISIAGKKGQKIVAAAPGEVVYSGEGLVGYGRLLIVQHKRDFLTAYAHNDRLLVREGQAVKKGQVIAYMGKTAAKTPRLHFEMRYKGQPVDPLKYLP